jgi:hypothetical protein
MEDIMRFMNRLLKVRTKLVVIAALLLTIVLIVIACGGGGGGTTTAGGGVSGTGSSTGTVTAFGSIWVNGIEYDTTSAEIKVNGENATESDLKIGMKVNVKTVNNIASSIEYDSEVRGEVSNKGAASFEVLRQTVKVNTQTEYCFYDEQINCTFSFADLSNGDFVEVSGYFDSNGDIIATMVKLEDLDPGQYQVKGIVSSLITSSPKNFKINNLTVYYSGNPLGIADGVLVKVIGTLYDPDADELIADEVEVEDTQASPGKELSLEGIVTQFTSQSNFEVNGQPVLTNDQTQFEGDPALIDLNVKVEVKGTVNSSGKLVAKEVNIEDTDIED